jgi:hypothetical protein
METGERHDKGLDVFDLAEFPIGALGERAPVGLVSLEFNDKGKAWRVEADPRYGLPTTIDVEVYVALLATSRGQDLTRQILFTPSSLLRDMGWPHKGESYERLLLAMQRWDHTQIVATNAVHDPKTGIWQEVTTFRILDGFRHYRREARAGEGPRSWWFRWGATMADLLAAGYHHELDVTTYMRLKSPIAQAELRYLSAKSRDGKEAFEQHLLTYAQQHVGLRQSYVSKIKEKLAPGHRQLMACGFIKSVEYGVMKSGPNRGEAKIIVRLARRSQPAPEGVRGGEAAAPPCSSLIDRLIAAGITEAIARELVDADPEVVARQLEYWPDRDQAKYSNPAGALVKAIRQDWAAPEGRRRREKRQALENQQRTQEATLENQGAAAAAAFDDWWATLPEVEREALTARAQNELIGENSTVGRHFERHPERLQEALRPILMRMAQAATEQT